MLMTNSFRAVVRTIGRVSIITALMGASASAQQRSSSPDSESLRRIRAALTQQQLVTTGAPSLFDGTRPDEWHVGVLTFLSPDTPGEFMRVRVPVGAIVSRAAHSVAAAQRHRAESAAHDDVLRVVAALQKPPTK